METTKTKIVDIQTGKAQKNVKTLRQQIKELREEMAQLEKGTESYDKAAKQLADLSQKQIEINEAQKYSNKDLGATLSNLTSVAQGVVGAISSINSVMVLMGADSEEAMEAMKRIQSLMAIIQGLSAIDTAAKALKGLTVAFQGFNDVRVKSITTSLGASGAELVEAGALAENTKEMVKNNETAVLYNEAQRTNVTETNRSTEALLENNLAQLKSQEAMIDRMVANRKTSAEMAVLNNQLKEGTITAEEYQKTTGVSAEIVARYKARIDETVAALERLRGMQTTNMKLAEELQPVYDAQTGTIKENSLVKAANSKATSTNTTATNGNTAAKKANAKATEDVTDAEKKLGTETKKTDPILRKAWSGLTTGIKNAAKALWSFVKTNPILTSIAVVIGVITYALVKYTNAVKEANKERKLMADISADVNHTYEEETVRLNTLLKTVNNVYETQAERKKAYEELNKIIPEYNAHLDETTGKYVANDKALEDYLAHLKEKAYLEAYEGKIKEYMQEQLELQLKINKIQNSGWNLFGWRINKAKKEIGELDKDIDEMYRKILNLDLSKALDENKPTQSPVKTVLKTFKDIIDSIKSLYADIWNTIFNEKELRITYNGVYRETDILFNNIERLIKSRNIQGLLSDEFKKAMSEGFTDDMSFNITLDWVFDRTQQEKFYNELEKERINLEKMMSDKTKKYTDDEIKAQQDKVNGLKAEEESRKLVLEAVQKYFVQRRKEADETERLANTQENYNHQLEVEKNYIKEQRRGDRDAEANKEIALGEYQIETIKQRMQYRQSEIDMLKSLPLQNEQVLSRIKELNAEQLEDQKKTDEELAKVDNAYYQKRLNHLEKENGLIIANSEKEQRAEEIRRMIAGGGVVDYNTDVDLIGMQLKAIEQQKEKVNQYYKKEKSKYAEDTEEWLRLEQERLEALDRLQEEYSKKDIERQMADADRKLAIQKAYIAAYQSISSQVSNILGEVMNSYDESSKEYLRLKYAQGVTDTLSGTLAAYMSGIESGLVPPANTILAGVLAAMTFATGVAQLANIKKGSLSNAATPSTVQIGNEYDTLSYAQNAEILSNIQDSRVWVLESDISSTQQRVRVQETQSTF